MRVRLSKGETILRTTILIFHQYFSSNTSGEECPEVGFGKGGSGACWGGIGVRCYVPHFSEYENEYMKLGSPTPSS